MNWYTADLHLGHANIIKHCDRPFDSVEEMDSHIINNINELVQKSDTLYILGDFAYRFSFSTSMVDYRKRILCDNIHLIRGNHDNKSLREYLSVFTSVHDLLNIVDNNQRITLCHYSMRTWYQSHRNSWHLYGHSHGKLLDDPELLSIDVGVDCTGFYPLCFEDIQKQLRHKLFRRSVDRVIEKHGKVFQNLADGDR